jgi:peptide/nickel transport system permease protein
MLLVLLVVVVLNFLMLHLAPGDIADTIAQTMGGADEQDMAELRKQYGLDQPFFIQLFNYVGRVALLDFGHSHFYNVPVLDLIMERFPATLLLVFSAQILSLFVGILLGVYAAQNPNGLSSLFVNMFSLFGYAAPVFWTGILLLIALSLHVPIFPVSGMRDITIESSNFFVHLMDVLRHLFLPMITLASIFFAYYSRLCRASMLEVLGADFVRTAKAIGLSKKDVLLKHALKNSLSPVITFAGLSFSAVVSGAILVETVYSWPGLGTLAFNSIISRDTPVLLGILIFSTLMVTVGNLLTDLALRALDPRIKI